MGRQLGALFLAVGLACGGQAQSPEPAPATPPAPEPPPPPFDPAAAAPSDVVVALRDGTMPLSQVDRALQSATPREAGRLRWIAAHRAADESRWQEANQHLAALIETDHPLAPWAAIEHARWLTPHAPADAAEVVVPWIGEDWAGQTTARQIHALALLAAEDEGAVDRLRALVAEAPAHSGAATVAMPLARYLSEREDAASREEALALYRRVAFRAPKARVGAQAAARATEVWESLPEERREALSEVPIEDRFARAAAFYNGMHHRDAERAYAELARDLDDDDEARCRAQLEQGKAMLRRRRRAQGAEHMRAVAERCEDTDVRAWARYKAGRAYGQTGHRAEAIEQYEALLAEAPGHRLADDALFRAALTDMYAGNLESMVARLEAVPERFPDGDMAGEALFRLVMHARSEDDHEAALTWLDRGLRDGEAIGEEAEDIRGRIAYWRARTLQDLERTDEAVDAFAELAQRWPLSYYAQQSMHRLAGLNETRHAEVLQSMHQADGASSVFPRTDAMDTAWFTRFLELAAVGRNDLAGREARHAGATHDDDMVWVVAAVFAQSNALPEVARLLRPRQNGFRRALPVGDAYQRWRLAYPRAFAPLIEDAASDREVPSSFVRAIAREESSFDPRAVSWAHAYGLVQVILPTARRFGRHLDVPINARTLRQPEVNVAVGANYMRYLRDRYGANPA
ncbi:MAG: transglycosylase SLT domain-containing protein, partial [Myxococcota bacterium]